jgi:hypothetical protein
MRRAKSSIDSRSPALSVCAVRRALQLAHGKRQLARLRTAAAMMKVMDTK